MIGVVIAGGASSRFGGRDKALITLAGRPLVVHLIERLWPQVDRLAINSNSASAALRALGFPVFADALPEREGPVFGVHAALACWPEEHVLTVAADVPFIPRDLAQRLKAAAAPCAYAVVGSSHAPAALWAPGSRDGVRAFLDAGRRRLGDLLRELGTPVAFTPGPEDDLSLNVNTLEELARAERWYASRRPV